MKRVLYLIDSLGSGGAQRQLLELVRHLPRDGSGSIDPVVCVYHPDRFYADNERYRDIPVRVLPKRGRFDPLFVPRLASLMARERVDLVHAFLLAPSAWALAAASLCPRRVKVVLSERTAAEADIPGWHRIRRIAYPRADRVIANSDRATRLLTEQLGLPPGHIRTVHNGIDAEHWSRPAPPSPDLDRALARLPAGVTLFGMIASFSRYKDQLALVRALARLARSGRRDFGLILAGRAVEPEVLAAVLGTVDREGLGDRVIRVDALPDPRALLHRLDAFVLSSRFEGFPNVVVEAMAAACPVVASDVSDLLDLLGPEAVFPVGDDAALASLLLRLMDMPREQRRAIGRDGQDMVRERFTIAKMVSATLGCYDPL